LYRYFPDREVIVEEVIRREILPDLDRALLHQQLALLKGDPEAWSHFRRLALAERLRFLIDGVVRPSRLLVARFGLEFLTRYRDQLPHALGIPPGGDPRLTRLIVEDCADQMRLADPQLAAPILAAVIIQIAPLLVSNAASEDLSTEALVDEVLGLLLRDLGTDTESAEARATLLEAEQLLRSPARPPQPRDPAPEVSPLDRPRSGALGSGSDG